MKRVLVIDDKEKTESYSSVELIESLNENQRKLIDLKTSVQGLWTLNDNEDKIISLNFDANQYQYIFLHQSFNDPILNNPNLLIDQLPADCFLTLFSGGRSEALSYDNDTDYNYSWENFGNHYEIRRSIYFEHFSRFIDSYLLLGAFSIQALYDEYFNPKKERALILDNALKILLEESLETAINSQELIELLDLNGYIPSEIDDIKRNYLSFDDDEFIEAIEDLSVNL